MARTCSLNKRSTTPDPTALYASAAFVQLTRMCRLYWYASRESLRLIVVYAPLTMFEILRTFVCIETIKLSLSFASAFDLA